MRCYYRYTTLLAAACFLTTMSYAGIINGGFEDIEPNVMLDFDPPSGWERENYAAVMEQFIPNPSEGNVENWQIDIQVGLRSVEGDSFVVLSSGDIQPDPPSASIQQYVFVYAGETISGYYFFGTSDYLSYNDYATIKLVPYDSNSGLRDLTIVYVDVEEVGDYNSTAGWVPFEYTFSSGEGGAYHQILSVTDMRDRVYPSYLAADYMRLCEHPAYGDINRDCRVDFRDLSWLASDWMQDCSDPNYLADPNNNCSYGTDIDNNGPVDANDLMLMSDYWLDNDSG